MASPTSASPATTAAKPKVCFNSNCKQPLEQPRRGWRRRSGDFAELCDRCASAYEEAKFCETFHLNASGWRCCETCGKQIHCGCIGSFHLFVLLDAGGIECITCTRKSFILTPNPAWPPPSLFLPLQPERVKDFSSKDWSPIAGSGPIPWRQAPSLFNGLSTKSELQGKTPFEIDVSGGSDRLRLSDRLSASSLERKMKEDSFEILTNGSLKPFVSDVFENGDDGFKYADKASACLGGSQQTCFPKNDSSTPNISMNIVSSSKTEMNNQAKISTTSTRSPVTSPSVGKQNCTHNGLDTSGENPSRTGKARGDVQARNRLLPRYWPRITDQELQQISGDTNSIITPLFEKILSASDAGRIGRLVLPKKCAEAYLPPISQPEGVPLKVQDVKGNEWVFQFRFWPNNNSRMYVLEGVTPCIQAMQLQAGDIVTFSRREPEGRLVMGGRKASTAPSSDQGKEAVSNGNGVSANGHISGKSTKPDELDPASICSQIGKSGHGAKEITEAKPSIRVKRKNSTLASKTKRLRIENEDMIELKLTWKQAQGLIRPPPNNVPKVIVIEGYEFEEYEDAPIIGRPTIPANDDFGGKVQWVQCEDCLKWRKIPADTLLPSRWTCSANSWDPERSICSAAQEFPAEQLQNLLPTVSKGSLKKKRAAKQDSDSVVTLEGLDTLANLAIREEGASSQATTRHPRHKPGCSCIVCMQPPSGKGSKHKQSCDCIVCESLRRRFKRIMTKKLEKQQLEKEAETASPNMRQDADADLSSEVGTTCSNQEVSREDDSNGRIVSASPSKTEIDLNIQPEREEGLLPQILNVLWCMPPIEMERIAQQLKHSDSGGGGA